MKKEKARIILFYILAAAIPLAGWLLVFTIPHVTQGGYTILVSDLNGQYVNYLMYFRNAIWKHEELSYTFSGLLGTDTASLIGYYLLSPLNLLILFFPAEQISRAIFVIVSAKIALSGLSSAFFFGRKRNHSFTTLIFSTSYALSGYIFAYYMHLMWLDALYMLPLVAFGVELLIEKKKKIPYILLLAYTIIVCYYTGYMVAGFALLYFVYFLVSDKRESHKIATCIGTFIVSSIAAGLIAAVVLIPTALSQFASGRDSSVVVEVASHNLLPRFFTGSFSVDEFMDGAPNIYVGMGILFLTVLYFFPDRNKKYSRKKAASLIFWAFMIVCFFVEPLDRVWHIMAQPHSFTHRYAFVFVFVTVMIAEECLANEIKKVSLPAVILSNVIIAFAGVIAILTDDGTLVSIPWIIVDIVCTATISVLIYIFVSKDKKNKEYVLFSLFMMQLVLMGVNGLLYQDAFTFDDRSTDGYYIQTKPVVEKMQRLDKGLYRAEKNFFNSNNDSMLLTYNGLTFFSSSDKEFVRNFLGRIGYNLSYYWASFDFGAMPSGDSLMGVKYILDNVSSDNENEIATVNNVAINENKYSFGLGFAADDDIKNVQLSDDYVFENQQKIYNAILGRETDFIRIIDDVTIDFSDNLTVNVDEKGSYFVTRPDEQTSGNITVSFVAENDNPVYLFMPSTYQPVVYVTVNGKAKGEYLSTYHQGILPVGSFEPGEEVIIGISLSTTHAGFGEPQLVYFDEKNFADIATEIQKSMWQVNDFGNAHINATLTADEDGVLFTSIPYQKGWKVWVDNKEVETYCILDTLIAYDFPVGTHTIEMKYVTPGFKEGIVLSLIGVAITVFLAVFDAFRNKKEEEFEGAFKINGQRVLIFSLKKEDFEETDSFIKNANVINCADDGYDYKNGENTVQKLSQTARLNKRIVGCVFCSKRHIVNEDESHEVLEVSILAVDSEYIDSGLKKALMDETVSKAREEGYTGILVRTKDSFFADYGFITCDFFEISDFENKYDDTLMAYPLNLSEFRKVYGRLEKR